ncbi:MAG: hypothetical protein ACI4MK_13240 [Aristaeellaceae bacterium]
MDMQLRDIQANATYVLEDEDEGALGTVSGQQLLDGWTLEIPEKRTCRIIYYTAVKE